MSDPYDVHTCHADCPCQHREKPPRDDSAPDDTQQTADKATIDRKGGTDATA